MLVTIKSPFLSFALLAAISLQFAAQGIPRIVPIPQQQSVQSPDQSNQQTDIQRELTTFTGWLVVVGFLQVAALIGQAFLFWGTLGTMRDSSERQLRAYVVGESGYIVNVANPVPIFEGQVFQPSGAEITNTACGPIAYQQIKNTGQTPAFQVTNWGNICIREHPLTSPLPSRPAGAEPVATVVGPGIINTKRFFLNPPLTPEQIANLRAGTAAIYVYGEISYVDAFRKRRFTRYRLMHHIAAGAIGVSTDLSYAEEGNEAD